MRNLTVFLLIISFQTIWAQDCYHYHLYPSKYSTGDLFGTSIISLNNANEFIATGSIVAYDFYVLRTEQCGDTIWQREFDFYHAAADETPWSAILNSAGNILIQGTVYDSIEGARDNFILEMDTNGNVLHYARIDAGYNDLGWNVKQTSDDNYVIGGTYWSDGGLFLLKTDSTGNILWQKDYELNRDNNLQSIDITIDNGFILGGYYDVSPFSYDYDMFLIKTDSLGNQLWSKSYGLNNFDETIGYVITTLDGGFLLTGYKRPFPGSIDSLMRP